MREAIGNTFIVNLLLVFIGILSALLIGSISYSKAFKVKNRIIYTIEKYGGWNVNTSSGDNIVRSEIEASLKDIGYHIRTASSGLYGTANRCSNRDGGTLVYGGPGTLTTYHYCVYQYDFGTGAGRGAYYGVTAFMHFDIPLIGNYIEFPVYGETKSLYDVGVHFNN
jgi:hypothetical protein